MASPQQQQRPSVVTVQGALVLGQVFFGLGSVIAALGLPACNPLAFALYRETTAGSILYGASLLLQKQTQPKFISNWPRFVWLGFFIFINQAGNIVGIKLAGAVVAAVWQPSQPILTAAICMLFQLEPRNSRRIGGVLLSFLGCAAMVILSTQQQSNTSDNNSAWFPTVAGHVLLFFNCLGTSLFVILSKAPLLEYSSLSVVAWSYLIAAMFMAITAVLVSFSSSMTELLCPDCTGNWNIPYGAIFALCYFILFNSVGAYALLTWANQYVTGTLVMGYTVLQPVTAALLTIALLGYKVYPNCVDTSGGGVACLDPPGWGAVLGMMGVFGGLGLVITTEPITTTNVGPEYEPVVPEETFLETESLQAIEMPLEELATNGLVHRPASR